MVRLNRLDLVVSIKIDQQVPVHCAQRMYGVYVTLWEVIEVEVCDSDYGVRSGAGCRNGMTDLVIAV